MQSSCLTWMDVTFGRRRPPEDIGETDGQMRRVRLSPGECLSWTFVAVTVSPRNRLLL